MVVGYSATPLGWEAFKWDQVNGLVGLGHDGGCPSGEGPQFTSRAEGINNSGIIVGHTSTATRCAEAFTWQGGTFTLLGVLPSHTDSAATDINDAADPQVVGASYGTAALRTPFIWDSTNGMTGLAVLGGYTEAWGMGVNDAGDVVGSSAGGPKEATVWLVSNGMTPLGLGYLIGTDTTSDAWDINNEGQVVGNSTTPTDGYKAFVWDQCNGMRDLNNLVDASGAGWTLWWARAINEAGQIAGYGLNPSGDIEAFLLTPITGACCDGTVCTISTEDECNCIGGVYQGDGTTCDPNPCCRPDSTGQFCIGVCDDPGLQCVPSLITELPTPPGGFEVTAEHGWCLE